jgi:hypothetical protein
MSGNRVEELEAKVRELEATIEGLTDELVETKERLGAIEDETGVQPDVLEGRGTGFERQNETGSSADAETTTDGETEGESESDDTTDSESGDDIIVA